MIDVSLLRTPKLLTTDNNGDLAWSVAFIFSSHFYLPQRVELVQTHYHESTEPPDNMASAVASASMSSATGANSAQVCSTGAHRYRGAVVEVRNPF